MKRIVGTLLAVSLGCFLGGQIASAQTDSDICSDPTLGLHLKDIETTRQQAEEYRPGLRSYYVDDFSDNQNIYLKAALSAKERKEYLANFQEDMVPCLIPALDKLAAVAKKTLPTYTPEAHKFRNPAEERLLRDAVDDISEATVFRGGFKDSIWVIKKDRYNLPLERFKRGILWVKYPNRKEEFCQLIYVNVVQDYAGGGTYGASRARFIATEFAGCPAGR